MIHREEFDDLSLDHNIEDNGIQVSDTHSEVNTPDSSTHFISNDTDDIENQVPQDTSRRKPTHNAGNINSSMYVRTYEVLHSFKNFGHVHISKAISEWKKSMMVLFVDQMTWKAGIFYLSIGLFLSFIQELCEHGPTYNLSVLLSCMAAIAYPKLPSNSVRTPLLITLAISISIGVDIIYFSMSSSIVTIFSKALIAMIILSKLLVLHDILWLSDKTTRARKYLARYLFIYSLNITIN
jgi:hypothetical protein